MPANRLQKWDILKCFLIFLVVLGHVADFYTKESQGMRNLYLLIYTFHMPLFKGQNFRLSFALYRDKADFCGV